MYFDDDKPYITPYCCNICQVYCASPVNLQAHFLGFKHRVVEEALKSHGLLKSLNATGEEVKHKQKLRTQIIPDYIQIEPEKAIAKTLEEQLDSCKDTEPAIGLQYITEYQTDGKPIYECSLCDWQAGITHMFMHVLGVKHMLSYLKRHYPELSDVKGQGSNLKKRLKAVALQVENTEGRKKIMVAKDFPPGKDERFVDEPTDDSLVTWFSEDMEIAEDKGKQKEKVKSEDSSKAQDNVSKPEDQKDQSAKQLEVADLNGPDPEEFTCNEDLLKYLENFEIVDDEDAEFILAVIQKFTSSLVVYREIIAEEKNSPMEQLSTMTGVSIQRAPVLYNKNTETKEPKLQTPNTKSQFKRKVAQLDDSTKPVKRGSFISTFKEAPVEPASWEAEFLNFQLEVESLSNSTFAPTSTPSAVSAVPTTLPPPLPTTATSILTPTVTSPDLPLSSTTLSITVPTAATTTVTSSLPPPAIPLPPPPVTSTVLPPSTVTPPVLSLPPPSTITPPTLAPPVTPTLPPPLSLPPPSSSSTVTSALSLPPSTVTPISLPPPNVTTALPPTVPPPPVTTTLPPPVVPPALPPPPNVTTTLPPPVPPALPPPPVTTTLPPPVVPAVPPPNAATTLPPPIVPPALPPPPKVTTTLLPPIVPPALPPPNVTTTLPPPIVPSALPPPPKVTTTLPPPIVPPALPPPNVTTTNLPPPIVPSALPPPPKVTTTLPPPIVPPALPPPNVTTTTLPPPIVPSALLPPNIPPPPMPPPIVPPAFPPTVTLPTLPPPIVTTPVLPPPAVTLPTLPPPIVTMPAFPPPTLPPPNVPPLTLPPPTLPLTTTPLPPPPTLCPLEEPQSNPTSDEHSHSQNESTTSRALLPGPAIPTGSDVVAKFLSSISDMDIDEVADTLYKIAASNPAFRGMDVPSVLKILAENGNLKSKADTSATQ